METTMKTDLEDFRLETRKWLEENCPASMQKPIKESTDYFWGGRNATFHSEDQKIWFERMLEKKWIVPYWDTKYGGGGLSGRKQYTYPRNDPFRMSKTIFSFGISMLGPPPQVCKRGPKMRFLQKLQQVKHGGARI